MAFIVYDFFYFFFRSLISIWSKFIRIEPLLKLLLNCFCSLILILKLLVKEFMFFLMLSPWIFLYSYRAKMLFRILPIKRLFLNNFI